MSKPPSLRCAVYTRKSSEEGLEQEFNSLDAQREAGEAYIGSQKHEGWKLLPQVYDDGGYSGGSMERPALKQLLKDIEAGKIDVVVVYKVDRLSRSLGDFARMVELFDKHKVSFVSVTQQFNTTTSMGRLTLNILLSFAQFEREVTGERIRDKMAASKQKGMWLGGYPPLGYDVVDKKLIINKEEALQVKNIFETYLRLKSVYKLVEYLNRQDIKTKSWITQSGKQRGGYKYTKNILYKLIANPVYIGQVTHHRKKITYMGQHEAIIHKELWDQVQQLLVRQQRSKGIPRLVRGAMLKGLVQALDSSLYIPTYTVRPGKKQYHYYIHPPTKHRMAARMLEKLIIQSARSIELPKSAIPDTLTRSQAIGRWHRIWDSFSTLASALQNQIIQGIVDKVICSKEQVTLRLSHKGIKTLLQDESLPLGDAAPSAYLPRHNYDVHQAEEHTDITVAARFKSQAGKQYVLDKTGKALESVHASSYDNTILAALTKAHRWKSSMDKGQIRCIADIAQQEKLKDGYVSRIMRLNSLSPRIKAAILTGTQPQTLRLQHLLIPFPTRWKEQEVALKIHSPVSIKEGILPESGDR